MKRLNTFIICSLFMITAYSQGVDWVRTVTSVGYDDCHDLAVDSRGNVYLTGQIEYTATLNSTTLSSAGIHDIFVAKYDSLGNLIWAKRAGGNDGDVGYSLAVDAAENVYVVGEIETTSYFDNIAITVQGSSNNMFCAKYDAAGHAEWVNNIGTNSGSTKGWAVACDPAGNVYACGTTRAKAYLNGTNLFTSRGSEDIILIKFDTHGNYIWHKQIGGSDSDEGFGLAVDGAFLYITGSFEGSAKFTSSFTLHSDDGKDFFLAQYDTSGSFQWAKAGGGSGDDIGWDVTVNIDGNIICTGEFQYTGTFGSNTISSRGGTDIFIAAYDANGDNVWVRSAGSSTIDLGENISHDLNGNIYVGGTFEHTAHFDQLSVASNGAQDVFLASYDSTGMIRYVKGFGGPQHDRGEGVGADLHGSVYYCGEYWSSISFDSIAVPGVSLYDGFLVRFGIFQANSSGISDLDYNVHFSVSPNPAMENVRIVLDQFLPRDEYFLEIYSLPGVLMMRLPISSVNEFSLSLYQNGIYCMRLINRSGRAIGAASRLIISSKS